jgi:hypothetical protein
LSSRAAAELLKTSVRNRFGWSRMPLIPTPNHPGEIAVQSSKPLVRNRLVLNPTHHKLTVGSVRSGQREHALKLLDAGEPQAAAARLLNVRRALWSQGTIWQRRSNAQAVAPLPGSNFAFRTCAYETRRAKGAQNAGGFPGQS